MIGKSPDAAHPPCPNEKRPKICIRQRSALGLEKSCNLTLELLVLPGQPPNGGFVCTRCTGIAVIQPKPFFPAKSVSV